MFGGPWMGRRPGVSDCAARRRTDIFKTVIIVREKKQLGMEDSHMGIRE